MRKAVQKRQARGADVWVLENFENRQQGRQDVCLALNEVVGQRSKIQPPQQGQVVRPFLQLHVHPNSCLQTQQFLAD